MNRLLLYLFAFITIPSNAQVGIEMNPNSCLGNSGTINITSCCINYDTHQWHYSSSSSGPFQPILSATQPIFTFDWSAYDHMYINLFVTYTISPNTISYFSDPVYLDSSNCNLNNPEQTFEDLLLFPNPVNEILTLRNIEDIQKITIFNTLGKGVFHLEQQPSILQLNLAFLPQGIYFLIATSEDKIQRLKFLKQ